MYPVVVESVGLQQPRSTFVPTDPRSPAPFTISAGFVLILGRDEDSDKFGLFCAFSYRRTGGGGKWYFKFLRMGKVSSVEIAMKFDVCQRHDQKIEDH